MPNGGASHAALQPRALVVVRTWAYLARSPSAESRMSPTMEFDAAEANRLYWETEQSVADIAQQLDISRRALYGAVRPLPAGAALRGTLIPGVLPC